MHFYKSFYGTEVGFKFSLKTKPPQFLICGKMVDMMGRVKGDFICQTTEPNL